MPTIETSQDIKIDVEVYCGTCGAGLCNDTVIKGHACPQLHVGVCDRCLRDLRNEKDEEIYQLTQQIKELQLEVKRLEEETK